MSRRYDLRLGRYEISKYVYRELRARCLQYPELRQRLRDMAGLNAPPSGPMVHGGGTGRPTETQAAKIEKISEECRLIETTVMEAGGDVYTWLLRSVTEEGITWEQLNPPIGRRQFYERRRRFYYLMALKTGRI